MRKEGSNWRRAINRLEGDYIAALAAAISRPRRGRPSGWQLVAGGRNPEHVALFVLDCVLRHRDEDEGKAPSRQTVAIDIALALGMDRRVGKPELVKVGMGLLVLADEVGLIRQISKGVSTKGDRREPGRVYLSLEAEARLADLMHRLASSDVALPDRPMREPPTGPVRVKANRYGKAEPGLLPEPYIAALDHVRHTPWRVNDFVFRTMFAMLDRDEQRFVFRDLQRDSWKSQVDRKDKLAAIMTAAQFREGPFYLDVFCDWRGRVYQGGPLRFTGADHTTQALLEFAEGQVVTDGPPNDGAGHLAAYIGYQWGQDDLAAAVQWTRDNEEMLLAIANDPHNNRQWLELKEKKRWHALAGADAWRRYREGLPVHLPCSWDATSSGFQIYALLMRDAGLGELVGLMEGSRGRLYKEVAERCGEPRDAAKAVGVPLLYGARASSSEKALAALDDATDPQAYKDRAKRLRGATEALAPGFVAVRDWLANEVAPVFKKLDQPIRWRTPSGFEVTYDNREHEGIKVKAWREGWPQRKIVNGKAKMVRKPQAITCILLQPTDALEHSEIKAGLAANLVHSLDANLLVATINLGSSRSLNIRSWGVVHDCFAVHPNDAYNLRVNASRMALFSVFGNDVLAQLHRQFEEQTGVRMPKPPAHEAQFTHHWMLGEAALTP